MLAIGRKLALFVIFAGTLPGCVTVGMFKFENRDKLALSEVTRDQALLLFGPPRGDRTLTNDHGAFDQILYGTSDGTHFRAMLLEFRSDRLNAYDYASTFPDDSTDFDENLYKQIITGAHLKTDVLNIMGAPHGKGLCPSALGAYEDFCEKGKEVWKWGFVSRREGPNATTRTKDVTVIFDGNGLVVDVKSKVESSRQN